METTESEFGLTLTLHSKANLDVYKNNRPCSFTNILKVPVKLNQDEKYEVCLANIHSPTNQAYVLNRSDVRRNDVRFHVGMFLYDEDKSKWELLKNSKIDLWSYSLNKDVPGLSLDNEISRHDFFQRFRDSFNISPHANLKQRKSLSIFNMFLRHKYDPGHDNPSGVGDCEKCTEFFASNGDYALDPTRERADVGDGLPHIDFFEDYDSSKKDHIWFKHLDDINPAEKYYNFDNSLSIIGKDKYAYLKDVIYNNVPHSTKIAVHRIVNRIGDHRNRKFSNFQKIFNHEIYTNMWYRSNKIPQLVLYASFGDKMAKYLSVDKNEKIVMLTCGNENRLNMFDYNPILIPQFVNPKIDSLFIYSDLVEKSIRVGEHITNLLSIITINNAIYNKPNPPTIYRPVSHNFVQSVSVKILDQNGDEVYFEPDSYIALEIVIRKR